MIATGVHWLSPPLCSSEDSRIAFRKKNKSIKYDFICIYWINNAWKFCVPLPSTTHRTIQIFEQCQANLSKYTIDFRWGCTYNNWDGVSHCLCDNGKNKRKQGNSKVIEYEYWYCVTNRLWNHLFHQIFRQCNSQCIGHTERGYLQRYIWTVTALL